MPSQKTKNGFKLFFIALLYIVIGFLLGKLYNIFPYIKLDTSIELFDVVSVLVTICLAYWISIYFFGKNNISASEKELLFRQVEELSKSTTLTADFISGNNLDYKEVVSKFKRLHKKYKRLVRLAEKVSVELHREYFESYLNQLKISRKLCTYTPSYSEDEFREGFGTNIHARINNGVVEYSSKRIKEIDDSFDLLSDYTFDIQIEIINRCKA